MKINLLVVDDDPDICTLLKLHLAKAGYNVFIAHDGKQAIELLNNKIDLILLDIMLPNIDGIELCEKIREKVFCPIIFISCVDEDSYILKAFKIGGDDYLIKPFNYDELIVRVEANLRRVQMDQEMYYSNDSTITYGEFRINLQHHTLFKNNKQIFLSPLEFSILIYMMNNQNKVLCYHDIYSDIWNKDSLSDTRTVMVHVHSLRKKIEEDPSRPLYIKTVRKFGYICTLQA